MPEPLRTTTFTLTAADALAYEQASARLSPLGVLMLLAWLGACGIGALLIPADWTGPKIGWASSVLVSVGIALGYVVALLLTAVRQWLAARRRLPRPLEVTLSEWPDRLDIVGTGLPATLPFKTIRESRLTRTHLLLTTDETFLAIPRRAFDDDEAMDELAARIAGRPAQPAPVRPPRAVA